jgi:hypothetical protein
MTADGSMLRGMVEVVKPPDCPEKRVALPEDHSLVYNDEVGAKLASQIILRAGTGPLAPARGLDRFGRPENFGATEHLYRES